MNCYNCGSGLHAGLRSCPRCGLDFPLPVPDSDGQRETFVAQPQKPVICDSLSWHFAVGFILSTIIIAGVAFMCLSTLDQLRKDYHTPQTGYAASSTAGVAP